MQRMGPCTDELKLVALDKDDIDVVSAHVQDSLVQISDIFWRPGDHRFVMALNRFDWMNAPDLGGLGPLRPSGTIGVAVPRCASSACWAANAEISIRDAKTRSSICSGSNSPKPMRGRAWCR